MINWFVKKAPINQKLGVAFGFFCALLGAGAAASWVGYENSWMVTSGAFLAALVASFAFRKAIADPYVATVVDMEVLAAGNTGIHISRTDYEDCVGRLSRAMEKFRDNTLHSQSTTGNDLENRQTVVKALGDGLRRLAEGQVDYRIDTPFPLELEQLHRVPEASSAYLCSSFFEAFLFLFLLCLAQLLNTTTI